MKSKSLYITSLVLLLILLLVANMLLGYQTPHFLKIFSAITDENNPMHQLVVDVRLYKILTVILTGMSLPVAGMMLQTLFNNPIADASILGVSSMASLGNAILIFASSFFVSEGILADSWLSILAGSIGAIIGLFFISGISYKIKNNASILVVGLVLSSLSSAIISYFQSFSSSEKIKNYLLWTMGSFDNLGIEQIFVFFITAGLAILICILTLKQLNILLLGEKYAETMGVQVSSFRRMIIILSGVLTAAVTVFVGPIAFVGFFIPHITRMLFKTTNHNWLFPANMLIGVCFLLLVSLSQILIPVAIPINVIMSFIGAPMAIAIIVKQAKFM